MVRVSGVGSDDWASKGKPSLVVTTTASREGLSKGGRPPRQANGEVSSLIR